MDIQLTNLARLTAKRGQKGHFHCYKPPEKRQHAQLKQDKGLEVLCPHSRQANGQKLTGRCLIPLITKETMASESILHAAPHTDLHPTSAHHPLTSQKSHQQTEGQNPIVCELSGQTTEVHSEWTTVRQ